MGSSVHPERGRALKLALEHIDRHRNTYLGRDEQIGMLEDLIARHELKKSGQLGRNKPLAPLSSQVLRDILGQAASTHGASMTSAGSKIGQLFKKGSKVLDNEFLKNIGHVDQYGVADSDESEEEGTIEVAATSDDNESAYRSKATPAPDRRIQSKGSLPQSQGQQPANQPKTSSQTVSGALQGYGHGVKDVGSQDQRLTQQRRVKPQTLSFPRSQSVQPQGLAQTPKAFQRAKSSVHTKRVLDSPAFSDLSDEISKKTSTQLEDIVSVKRAETAQVEQSGNGVSRESEHRDSKNDGSVVGLKRKSAGLEEITASKKQKIDIDLTASTQTQQSPSVPKAIVPGSSASNTSKRLVKLSNIHVSNEMTKIWTQIQSFARKLARDAGLKPDKRPVFVKDPADELKDIYQVLFGQDWQPAVRKLLQTGMIKAAEVIEACTAAALYSWILQTTLPWDGPMTIMGNLSKQEKYMNAVLRESGQSFLQLLMR